MLVHRFGVGDCLNGIVEEEDAVREDFPMRTMIRRAMALAFVLALLLPLAGNARADTLWNYYGVGQTYQNNYRSSCMWYDGRPGGTPCYQGVWSDTNGYAQGFGSSLMRVWERAMHHTFACPGEIACFNFYRYFSPDPYDGFGVGYVSTNGVHYYPGNFQGAHPANVIGWAWHQNSTAAPNGWWYTESVAYR